MGAGVVCIFSVAIFFPFVQAVVHFVFSTMVFFLVLIEQFFFNTISSLTNEETGKIMRERKSVKEAKSTHC